jgi:hypothetical protein
MNELHLLFSADRFLINAEKKKTIAVYFHNRCKIIPLNPKAIFDSMDIASELETKFLGRNVKWGTC